LPCNLPLYFFGVNDPVLKIGSSAVLSGLGGLAAVAAVVALLLFFKKKKKRSDANDEIHETFIDDMEPTNLGRGLSDNEARADQERRFTQDRRPTNLGRGSTHRDRHGTQVNPIDGHMFWSLCEQESWG
jgi:hypothetical protein